MNTQYIKIFKDLKTLLCGHFEDDIHKVILFGSRSRDSAQPDSDYDILIVLNRDYDWRKENNILRTCYEIDLKYDILTDVKMISLSDLHSIKGKQPFIINAINEGITV